MMKSLYRTLLLSAGLSIAAAFPAAADSVEDFYKGKTITIIVPFEPGGGSAGYAQLAVDNLGRHIPGNPTLTAEYMPGGGGIRAANYAYQVAPRDGTVLLVPNDAIAVSQLLNSDAAKYDAREFSWLGVISQNWHVLAFRNDAGVKTTDDLKNKELFVGSSGAGSPTDMYPRLTNGLLGTKMDVVPGFAGGSTEQILAVESGEMHGSVNTWRSWNRRKDLLDSGFLVPMLQYGSGRSADLQDIPNLLDLVSTPDDQLVVKFVTSPGPVGRGLAALPDVPEDRVAALREAFKMMLEDPEFLADAKEANLPLDGPMTWEPAQELIETALSASPEIIERTKGLVNAAGQ